MQKEENENKICRKSLLKTDTTQKCYQNYPLIARLNCYCNINSQPPSSIGNLEKAMPNIRALVLPCYKNFINIMMATNHFAITSEYYPLSAKNVG
jgi:hypothetical protein